MFPFRIVLNEPHGTCQELDRQLINESRVPSEGAIGDVRHQSLFQITQLHLAVYYLLWKAGRSLCKPGYPARESLEVRYALFMVKHLRFIRA